MLPFLSQPEELEVNERILIAIFFVTKELLFHRASTIQLQIITLFYLALVALKQGPNSQKTVANRGQTAAKLHAKQPANCSKTSAKLHLFLPGL
jgi:hypothetical protein